MQKKKQKRWPSTLGCLWFLPCNFWQCYHGDFHCRKLVCMSTWNLFLGKNKKMKCFPCENTSSQPSKVFVFPSSLLCTAWRSIERRNLIFTILLCSRRFLPGFCAYNYQSLLNKSLYCYCVAGGGFNGRPIGVSLTEHYTVGWAATLLFTH